MLVLENCELVVVVFHDGVESDDEPVGIDIEQVESNSLQNSKENVCSIASTDCSIYLSNHHEEIEQNDHDNSVDDVDLDKLGSS